MFKSSSKNSKSPAATTVTGSNSHVVRPSTAAGVVRACSAATAAVAAADGRVTITELIEVAVRVDSVPANQNRCREVGCHQHVRPVRSNGHGARTHALQCALFGIFDRLRKLLSSPVRHLEDGGGHAALVAAVLYATGQRVADSFLAVKFE